MEHDIVESGNTNTFTASTRMYSTASYFDLYVEQFAAFHRQVFSTPKRRSNIATPGVATPRSDPHRRTRQKRTGTHLFVQERRLDALTR